MSKKRGNSDPEDEYLDERGRPFDSSRDPLGKLIQQYHVSLAGVLLLSGIVLAFGLGIVAYAVTRQPSSLIFLIVGAVVALLSVVLLGMNAFNIGRRLELRKRGVRFVESGRSVEMLWEDIEDVQVSRRDETYLGPVSVRRESADASRPSGPLTKTEWNVTIRSQDGRTIRLRPMFLRIVPDPKKLISQLRLRSGLR
jgi:hypothetical protein